MTPPLLGKINVIGSGCAIVRFGQAKAAAPAPSDDREECILKIDHMNDADGYKKILRNWVRALALSGRVLYANSGKRVHGVFVVLHGAPSSVGGQR